MEERRALEATDQNLRGQKKKLTTEMNQKRTLQEQIDQKTRQLRSHQAEGVDVEDLKRKTQKHIKETLRKRVALIAEHYKTSEEQRRICQAR